MLIFSEVHLKIYLEPIKCVTYENEKLIKQFSYKKRPLTSSTLRKLNPIEVAAAFGQFYHQPFSVEQVTFANKRLAKLSLPKKEEEYNKGRVAAKQAVNRASHYNTLSKKSQVFQDSYEATFTIFLLNSNTSPDHKGLQLGSLALRLRKTALQELRFRNFVYDLQLLQHPDFLKGFQKAINEPHLVIMNPPLTMKSKVDYASSFEYPDNKNACSSPEFSSEVNNYTDEIRNKELDSLEPTSNFASNAVAFSTDSFNFVPTASQAYLQSPPSMQEETTTSMDFIWPYPDQFTNYSESSANNSPSSLSDDLTPYLNDFALLDANISTANSDPQLQETNRMTTLPNNNRYQFFLSSQTLEENTPDDTSFDLQEKDFDCAL